MLRAAKAVVQRAAFATCLRRIILSTNDGVAMRVARCFVLQEAPKPEVAECAHAARSLGPDAAPPPCPV